MKREAHLSSENWLSLIDEVSTTFNASPRNVTDILSELLSRLQKEIEACAIAIWVADPDTEFMGIDANSGLSESYVRYFNKTDRIKVGKGIVGKAMVDRKTLYSLNLKDEERSLPRWKDMMMEEGINALLVAPMFVEQKVIGAFVIYYRSPLLTIGTHHIQFIEVIANQIALTWDNIQFETITELYQSQLSARLEQLKLLQNITQTLNVSKEHSINDAIEFFSKFASQQFNAKGIGIFRFVERDESINLAYSYGLSKYHRECLTHLAHTYDEHSLVGRTILNKETVINPKIYDDEILDKKWKILLSIEDITSIIAIPLVVGEKVIAVLTIYYQSEHLFQEEEINILSMLSQYVGISIINLNTLNELQLERQNISRMVNSLADGLIVYNLNGEILTFNYRAEELLSVDSEELIGINPNEASEHKQKYLENVRTVSKLLLSDFESQEVTLTEPKNRVYEVTKVPLLDENKHMAGYMRIVHDVTKERDSEQVRRNFVAVASHQLRTPLTGIKWSLSMLLEGEYGELSPKQRSLIERDFQSTNNLIDIVGDILNVSRLENDRYGYTVSKIPLVPLLERVVERAHAYLKGREKDVILIFNNMTIGELAIEADEQKLEEALQNIVDNAVRYTVKGEVHVNLEIHDSHIRITVRDTGIGIPHREEKRVFDKFFRATNAIKTRANGSGLGLFITNEIIKRFNGRIWFSTEENKGTTFFIEFPIDSVESHE